MGNKRKQKLNNKETIAEKKRKIIGENRVQPGCVAALFFCVS